MFSKIQINKKLLPMKGHYFLFNAGTAPLVPYLSTYARQLGFSSATVGLIYTVLPICGLIAKPLFGAIADRFKVQKLLLLLFQVVTAISFFGIYFIPESETHVGVNLGCENSFAAVKSCYQSEDLIDDCMLERLRNDSASAKCNIICDNNSSMVQHLLCDKWNIPEYCNSSLDIINLLSYNTSNNQDMTAVCSYLMTDKTNHKEYSICQTYIPNGFHIEVLLSYSTLAINNECMSLPFQEFKLPDGTVYRPQCNVQRWSGLEYELDSCSVTCNHSEIQQMFEAAYDSTNEVNTDYTQQFWLFFMLMIINWVGQAVVVSVADAICFNLLETKPSHYGRQRLWGSVGMGIFSLLTGVLIDEFSEGHYKDYTVSFILMLIFMSLDVICSFFIKNVHTKTSSNILADMGTLLSSVHTFIFMLWTIAVGLCTGLLWNFLFWHIEDVAKLSCEGYSYVKTLQGLVSAIQAFGGEIPFMFLSGAILKKLGHNNMMILVLFAFGVRYILYSILTNPWWILPIEMLQGITFGMFYPTMTSYASVISPPGTETTVQGLIGAIFEGIGTSLGSFIGGRLFETYGGWMTFRWFGYGALVCCVLFFIIQCCFAKGRNDKIERIGVPTDDKDITPM